MDEAGVHILERVRTALEQAARIPVRLATEGQREYFAGLLRVINGSTLIHSDYAPYVSGNASRLCRMEAC